MIRLEGIERIFEVGDETVYALSNVDLTVEQGEYVSIMGPSGSGKSTLLNILGLLDRPDKGVYHFEDIDTIHLSDKQQAHVRRHKIGFIFQFFHLVARLTAEQNVELPMILAGIDARERKQRVHEALGRMGLNERMKHRPDQLSGGQRQRVAIARSTIMNPAIILADEPTGNLDRASGMDVIRTIEDLNKQGMTVVMVTHDPELGGRTGRQVRMEDGRIIRDTSDERALA
ncbi:MAG: ABC transporter ATP-binding protein [Desulfobacteraceae bacterium]|nr:ABC transporter ATP-binding protein [Desulfobacteraceae bacterium]